MSNDGPPAHPELAPRRINMLVIFVVIGLLLMALLLGMLIDPILGAVTAALSFIYLLANAAIWGSLSHASDRREAARRVRRRRRWRRRD